MSDTKEKGTQEKGASYKDIQILSEIGQQIMSTLSIEEIIEKTYTNINSLMDASAFGIGLYNQKENLIDFPGFIEKGVKLPFGSDNLKDKKYSCWCFNFQKELLVNDYHSEYSKYFPDTTLPSPVAGELPESLIYYPLTIQDKRIGVITVQSFQKDAYSSYHLDILRNLAVYVSTGLENARLYENMEAEVRERTSEVVSQKEELEISYKNIQLLAELGQQITAMLSVEDIIEKTYTNLNSLMDASGFYIGIYDAEKNRLVFSGSIEKGEKIPEEFYYDMKDYGRPAVWCFENQKEIILNDFSLDYKTYIPNMPVPKPISGEKTESLIYLPLTIQNKKIGVISVQSFKKNAYANYQITILKSLVIYVSIALENARLYENMETEVKNRTAEVMAQKEELEEKAKELTHSNHNLSLLTEIGKQITSSLDFESIFKKLHGSINSQMDAEVFGVRLFHADKNTVEIKYEFEKDERCEQVTFSMDNENNFTVWCIKNKKEIFINDNQNEYRKYVNEITLIDGEAPHSVIFCPMFFNDRVVGVITVQSYQKNKYTLQHLDIVRALANYTAIAIENAEAYKQLNLAMEEVEKLSIVVSKSNNTIVICNADTEMIWVNDAFIRTFGPLEVFKKIHGKTMFEFSSNPTIRTVVAECILQKSGVSYESKNETKDNGVRWFQTSLSPIFDESGTLQNIVFIDSDITELKIIEEQLQHKNKEVMDSIYYARRIQQALFVSDYYINKFIQEYFILFQPKDIVSGDFYWLHSKDECIYIVTADCTGHGVPGALMSMMGINLLNNIIIERGISNPALILDIMREEIILKLNPEGSVEEAKDGMDMVLCKLDIKNRELEYAAANNSLYILRNGELTEYKGDKMPVGKYSETAESFTKHKVKLEKGDILYSFTDGYPDQFGGEKGKKFKYKQLEELLISSGTKPMTAQKRLFEKTIKTWKGDFEQVDDILMIGIKVD